jgi:hypothetical protein
MKVLCDIDANIRIGGLNLPCTFAVIENLGFQAELGMQFLHDAKAVIDVANHTLSLYDGLTAVQLVRADDNAFIVRTVNRIANRRDQKQFLTLRWTHAVLTVYT